MRSAFLVVLLAGLLPALLRAEDQSFAFALPEAEGRISLGVYDASGKLVRTLFTAAEEKDFKIGLNGLITTWDGKNDEGAALPSGKYHVQGWVVPDSVQAEGVAYHFNDWILDETSPRISGVGAVVPGGQEDALMVFGFRPGSTAAEERLWAYDDAQGLKILSELPPKAVFFAGAKGAGLFFDRTENVVRFWPELTSVAPIPGSFADGTIWKGKIVLRPEGESAELVTVDPASGQRGAISAPSPGLSLDAGVAGLAGWAAGKIWLRRADTFEPVPIEGLPEAFDLSVGSEETLWIAGRSGPEVIVRQHSFAGELLREMKIREDFAEQVHVFASKSSLSFYLLLQSTHWSRQTLRGYRPASAPAAAESSETTQVDWEVFFDKTIENSRRFGLKDGRLVADVGDAPQPDRQKIALPEDSLTGKKGSIVVTAVSRQDGLWLASGDGLPLRRLSEGGAERVVVAPGQEGGSLRLFTGDGVVVAEYLLTGLTGLAAIDAGEVELP